HNEGGNVAQAILPANPNGPSERNHFLVVKLVGVKSNRDGTGARLKLTSGDFHSYDQAKGGMSYISAQDPRIFFGLGNHARVDSLDIWWPSGLHDRVENLPVDVFLTVEEGKIAKARPPTHQDASHQKQSRAPFEPIPLGEPRDPSSPSR
ncbi:MAG TPA: ASPIC/UnbV domain-containing protein, partial [Candidatus Angelobacter sp.]|nr:ASPIC/UnbV domain-containing protein [Candidatus Angelobacter sp.]